MESKRAPAAEVLLWVARGCDRFWPVSAGVDGSGLALQGLRDTIKSLEPDNDFVDPRDGLKKRRLCLPDASEPPGTIVGCAPTSVRRDAWNSTAREMGTRLLLSFAMAPAAESVLFTEATRAKLQELLVQKRVFVLVTQRSVYNEAPRKAIGSKNWHDVDPEVSALRFFVSLTHRRQGNVLPSLLAEVAVARADVSQVLGMAKAHASKLDKTQRRRAVHYAFVVCVSVVKQVRKEGRDDSASIDEDDHVCTILGNSGAGLAYHVAGLGFVRLDDPALRLAVKGAPDASDAQQIYGGINWRRPMLLLPVDALSCPGLPDSPVAGSLSMKSLAEGLPRVPNEHPPYLFNLADAPGSTPALAQSVRVHFCHPPLLTRAQDMTLMRDDGLGSEMGVLCFLRFLCAYSRLDRDERWANSDASLVFWGGNEVSAHWLAFLRTPRSERYSKGLQLRHDNFFEAAHDEERFATWFLLYVFCNSRAGMAFFVGTLCSLWRRRLASLNRTRELQAVLRRADMEQELVRRSSKVRGLAHCVWEQNLCAPADAGSKGRLVQTRRPRAGHRPRGAHRARPPAQGRARGRARPRTDHGKQDGSRTISLSQLAAPGLQERSLRVAPRRRTRVARRCLFCG